MPSMNELIALIGGSIDSDEFKAFCKAQTDIEHEKPEPGESDGYFDCEPGGYCINYERRPKKVKSVHVYIRAIQGYEPFTGDLRGGLAHEADVDGVRAAWGEPTRSGADDDGTPRWDRFDSDEVCLHVRYTDGGTGFDLLTLMDPATAP